MNEVAGEATDPIVDAVVRASRALVGITVRALASVSDEVTLPQLRTLVVVSLQGPQTVSALADRLDVHASTMTRMCNRLVTRGLVVRTPSATDRREVVITLSTSGKQLVEDVTTRRRHEVDAIVQRMTPHDREAVVTALEQFANAAGEDRDDDTIAPEALASNLRTIAGMNAPLLTQEDA
jgi:DNA-binding MarR family transcriptional regulator